MVRSRLVDRQPRIGAGAVPLGAVATGADLDDVDDGDARAPQLARQRRHHRRPAADGVPVPHQHDPFGVPLGDGEQSVGDPGLIVRAGVADRWVEVNPTHGSDAVAWSVQADLHQAVAGPETQGRRDGCQ